MTVSTKLVLTSYRKPRLTAGESYGRFLRENGRLTTPASRSQADNQMGKRNIADIDRIALARDNKVESGKQTGRGNKKVLANLPEPIDTRKELAKSAGVGERTFDAGKMILEAAATGEISQADVQAIRDKRRKFTTKFPEIFAIQKNDFLRFKKTQKLPAI